MYAMDVRALRYFVHVARLESFSQASVYLGIAQPALSRQIRKLETILGCQLLFRSTRGVQTTEAGARLLDRGETILRQIEAACAEVNIDAGKPVGELMLGVVPGAGYSVVPTLIERLRHVAPGIRLCIVECDSTGIVEGLINDRLDAAIGNHAIADPALVVKALYTEPIQIVGPTSDPAGIFTSSDDEVSLLALQAVPLIMPGPRHALRMLVDRAARNENVSLTIVDEVNGSPIVKRMVKRGLGYSFFGSLYVREETVNGALRSADVASAAFRRTTSFVTLARRPASVVLDTVFRELKGVTSELWTDAVVGSQTRALSSVGDSQRS